MLLINLIYLRTPLELYKLHFCKVLAIFTSNSEEGTHNIKHFFHHSLLELYSERKRSNLSKDLLWAERKLNRTEDSISAFSKICCFEVSHFSGFKIQYIRNVHVDYLFFENIVHGIASNCCLCYHFIAVKRCPPIVLLIAIYFSFLFVLPQLSHLQHCVLLANK